MMKWTRYFSLLLTTLFFNTGLEAASLIGQNMTIQLSPNQKQFEVSLAANPTTGYQWSLVHYDKKRIQLLHSQYQKPQTNRIGAGGQMVFRFALTGKTKNSSTQILFKYARPWEATGGTKKQVIILFPK